MIFALFLSFAALPREALAESFLANSPSGRMDVSLEARSEELQAALGAMLGCNDGTSSADHAQLTKIIRESIMPIWQSLPKNQHDRVEWKMLRLLAHRHFMQRYNVLVRGLEPTIKVNSSHAGAAEILSMQAPTLVKQLTGPQAEHGFSLDNAVAMMAALEHLLFDSDNALLVQRYASRGFQTHQSLTRAELQHVLRDYMVYWMVGDDKETAEALLGDGALLSQSIPHWDMITAMVDGSVRALEHSRQAWPQAGGGRMAFNGFFTFEDALSVASNIGRNFGNFWETQCQDIKSSLIDIDPTSTGRVRLPDFYKANKDGEWRFGESEEYLRELGALDESSYWRGKQVIISNYMQAASNCVVTRSHYLVCCRVECEDILGEIEKAVGAPVAEVEEVLRVVNSVNLGSDKPVAIDAKLRNQLLSIADTHGGKVPLHGRLFAQWLHYVYPLECAFPHVTGAVASVTPGEYGERSIVNTDYVNKHIAADVVSSDIAANATSMPVDQHWMSQWSEEEELLGDYSKHIQRTWNGKQILGFGGAAAVLVALIMVGKNSNGRANNVVRRFEMTHSHYV